MARFRFQFSLASLLLFTTIVCLSVALWVTGIKYQRAQSELQRYRDELGHLTISDPNKVHAIGLKKSDSSNWYWHVHIPEGRKCYLRYVVGDIPNGDDPKTSGSLELTAGESTVFARMESNLEGKKALRIGFDVRGRSTTSGVDGLSNSVSLEGKGFEWLRGTVFYSYGANKHTVSAEPGTWLLLKQQCWRDWDDMKGTTATSGTTTNATSDNEKGIRIWIGETPDDYIVNPTTR